MITTQALLSLRPNSQFDLRTTEGVQVLTWNDKEQTEPTQAEIDTEIIRLQAEYDAQEYARNRKAEYPPIADQQDMQFHDAIDGTTTWQDAIQAVKTKYPKSG